jgi:predicted metalloprotease
MRWEDLPESQNVEDRRGEEGGGFARGGGGLGGIPGGAGGLSIGTIVILGLIAYATGIDPRLLIGTADQFSRQQPRVEQVQPGQPGRPGASPKDETGRFVTRISRTESTWKDVFARSKRTDRPPVLVLYSRQTHANCGGTAMAAMGPFYCPADKKIYLDTSFFQMIETRFRGCDVGSQSCRFAQAYVIAHEVAHHVQNELGILQTRNGRGGRRRSHAGSQPSGAGRCRRIASPASGRTARRSGSRRRHRGGAADRERDR